MSMSKKIFLIVVLMTVLSVAIMVLGLYSINALTKENESMARRSSRAMAMAQIGRITVERRAGMLDLISASNDEEIKEPLERLKNNEKAMDAAIQSYVDNLSAISSPQLIAHPGNVRTLWADYIKITNEVIAIAVKNTNGKAVVLYDADQKLWDNIDGGYDKLTKLYDHADTDEVQALGDITSDIRTDFAYFLINLGKFISETDAVKVKEFESRMTAFYQNALKGAKEVSEKASDEHGGKESKELYKLLSVDTKTAIDQISPLARENSNGEAIDLLNKAGVPARKKWLIIQTMSLQLLLRTCNIPLRVLPLWPRQLTF